MAKGFRCARCKRSFTMAAHLARHMSAIHGRGGGKTVAKKGVRATARVGRPKGSVARKVGRPKGSVTRRPGTPAVVSTRLVGDMRAYHRELTVQRESLDSQIDGIARAIEAMGATVATRPTRAKRRGRPPGAKAKLGRPRTVAVAVTGVRAGSLKDYVVRVLRQETKPISPRDLGAKVVKAGFKTKAKDVTKAVSNALPQLKAAKKVGFGKYQLVGRG